MGGFNELCAKVFCLALLKVALADRRRCYIILFAHDVISYELNGGDGLEQAIHFVSQRFRDGTDLAACLSAVVKRMEGSLWQDADAVVVSDFIAQRLSDEIVSVLKLRQQQQRFHAVAMSVHGKPGILRIFDHIWRFDTGMKSRLLRRWLATRKPRNYMKACSIVSLTIAPSSPKPLPCVTRSSSILVTALSISISL